jgi:hypothetical protein
VALFSGEINIITQNICPPIPIRCYDWVAWYDGREDWITGSGETEEEAVEEE